MTDNRCEELFKTLPGDLTGYPDEGRKRRRPVTLDAFEVDTGREREPAGYAKFLRIYYEVINNILGNMSVRFASLPELRFFSDENIESGGWP